MSAQIDSSYVFKTASAFYLIFAMGKVKDISSFKSLLGQRGDRELRVERAWTRGTAKILISFTSSGIPPSPTDFLSVR
jgi:hypothetical protein